MNSNRQQENAMVAGNVVACNANSVLLIIKSLTPDNERDHLPSDLI